MTENEISATPDLPATTSAGSTQKPSIKPATPDLITFDEASVNTDDISRLIFEQIGAQELINTLQHDNVGGQNVVYQIVSNTNSISNTYNPKNLLNTPGTIDQYFKNFAIRLETHIPEIVAESEYNNVYIDRIVSNIANQNSLVVEVINMKTNERVELEILNNGEYLSDIIEGGEQS